MTLKTIAITLILTATSLPSDAADFSDPTWPCVQRKVENLSLGLMWPYTVEPDAMPLNKTQMADISELSGYLSLRRIELDSLQLRVDNFAKSYQGDVVALGLVFSDVFDRLSKRRARIIQGIGDFSLSQIALADQIETARTQMQTALAEAEPDFDRVDSLEEKIDWDQVIYTDRQRNISYLCETPTLIERRLFSIAQMLQKVVQDQG